jgi:hypothetical protein
MKHILIQFPVFTGSLTGEPMSKPRSAISCHAGRVRTVAKQTKLPPRKTLFYSHGKFEQFLSPQC